MQEYNIRRRLVLLLILASCLNLQATPILSQWQDGTASHLFNNWDSSDTLDLSDEDGQTLPALGTAGLTLSTGVAGAGETVNGHSAISVSGLALLSGSDLFYTTAFGAVNANNLAGMAFDFYTANTEIVDLGFYFRSTANGGSVWYYSLPSISIGAWNTYYTSFSYSSYWIGFDNPGYELFEGSAAAEFSAALASVSQLGFYVEYLNVGGAGNQVYGIDNFGLTVPEPETYLALGMALLTVAIVFRKNISESLAEARAVMLR